MLNSDARAYVVWPVRTVRRFIGWLGLGFPFTLLIGALAFNGWPPPTSISGYYYSPMRYVFIVFQLGLGASLIYYQYRDPARDGASSTWDAVVSTLAGLFAIGVAVFPPAPGQGATPLQNKINYAHLVCAILFFLSLAVIVLFFFTRPVGPFPRFRLWLAQRRGQQAKAAALSQVLSQRTPEKLKRNVIYECFGLVMLLCGALMLGWLLFFKDSDPQATFIFWMETASVVAFACAWLVKGELFWRDKKGAQGQSVGLPSATSSPPQPGSGQVAGRIGQHPLVEDLLQALPARQWAGEQQRAKWIAAHRAIVDLLESAD